MVNRTFKRAATLVLASSALLGAVGFAGAEPAQINVAGALGTAPGGGSTLTDAWNEYQLFANTTSTQFNTVAGGIIGQLGVGDNFADNGNANFTSPLPAVSGFNYAAGINQGMGGGVIWSEVTIAWSGLSGSIVSITPITTGPNAGGYTVTTNYVAGTVFNFYYDQPADHNYGATVGSGDDTGFTDGTPVLTLVIDSGTGSNTFSPGGTFLTGSSNLFGHVTSAQAGFWQFASDGADFNSLINSVVPITITSSVDQNTNNVVQRACDPGQPANCLFQVDSDHDGSIGFNRVPEPSSIALLGIALAGIGFNARRRRSTQA